jgi:paraquat-inducible protein B
MDAGSQTSGGGQSLPSPSGRGQGEGGAPKSQLESQTEARTQSQAALTPALSQREREYNELPTAALQPERRFAWAWLFPLGAVILAGWLGWRAWSDRGIPIAVHLQDGFGIKTGDEVRYRGITVGKIDSVALESDLRGVIVAARLTSQADQLARGGSRFWVVRPQVQLTHIAGLETLIGPRFLAALPPDELTDAPRQYHFVGLEEPPIVDAIQNGDLEIILQSTQRGSLHPGAPVTYRQTHIGTILSVGLTSDGGAVEARAHILQPYSQLIRPNTRFWDIGGFQAKLGLTGVSIEVDSAEALLTGGVGLATPPPADAGGDIVRTGHRFTLSAKPEEDWLKWQPLVVIGKSMLPPGEAPPSPLRASIGWKQGRIFKGERSRIGWVLQTAEGLLGPADLFKPSDKADHDSIVLEVNGQTLPLDAPLAWERNGLGMLKAHVTNQDWPAARSRHATQPEDCLAIADPAGEPLPLSMLHLRAGSDGSNWQIDRSISVDPSWHGACVLSRADGKLIGVLLVGEKGSRVALIQ